MAKLAASEAATAVAHQVITSIDACWKGDCVVAQRVRGEGGMEFINFFKQTHMAEAG